MAALRERAQKASGKPAVKRGEAPRPAPKTPALAGVDTGARKGASVGPGPARFFGQPGAVGPTPGMTAPQRSSTGDAS